MRLRNTLIIALLTTALIAATTWIAVAEVSPDVIEKAIPRTVFLGILMRVPGEEGKLALVGSCSGSFVGPTGLILTASHCVRAVKDEPKLGIKNGEMITVSTPRGKIHLRAMVTTRIRPFVINGKKVHQIGIPWHWGWLGVMPAAIGDVTNDLVASIGDPTTYIQESKALLCDVKKGEV